MMLAWPRALAAHRSFKPLRRRAVEDVYRDAIKRLGAGADPEALLRALADGITLSPHGVA